MVQASARRHSIGGRERALIVRVLPGLMLVMLLGALDQTIMAPALPAVAGDLGGLDQIPAVVTAYFAAATVVMPTYGKLGDRFGRPRVLLVAIGVFMGGAVLCAIAQSMAVLVTARIIQGAGGGGLMIGAQAVLGEVVSPRERGRYLGLLSGVYILAAVGGPLLGGLVVDHLSWRWIFVGYLPLGLLALIMVRRTLRLPVPQARPPIDYAGAILLAIAVLSIVLLAGVVGRANPNPAWAVSALIVLAVAATATWLLTARRAADPILPLRLFRDRSFAIPTAISFLIGFALFGTVSYLPSYLQIATGASSTRAGLVVTVLMAGVIITLIISGQLISRTGRYRIFPIMGTALATGGLALLATVDPATPTPVMLAFLLLIGFGVGLTMQVMILVAQNGAPRADLGTATSTVTFLRQIGASAGVAVVGAMITLRFIERLPTAVVDRLPGGAGGLSAERLHALPVDLQAAVAASYGGAVPPVFGYVAPLLGVAFVLALALPARPLRDTAYADEPAEETARTPEPGTHQKG
ncbi:MAG TPA: MDR family MFS transporter [Propionibacteriaceae bacterium]|nr:MDR family MFS transporter [Propionibacteriaceae bacterium]